ncbi:MAG: hypothetical protein M1284_03765 [Candidatus Parvarchaeota archaeon]|jgi:hypothetical protein|nr:hypothetical protein [Candidatus Parvarchaeota archaeon]
MANKKGASGVAAGAFLLVIIIILFLYGPVIMNSLGLSLVPSATSLNHTVALGVISATAPPRVSPSSTFGITFLVANNLNGKAASDIYFCLDNLGLFTILSSPETSSPNPSGNAITSGRCVTIPSLATGDILSEGFTLSAPPASSYGNIQYSQNIGYYLNFSYVGSASQQLEFVSQSASSSGSYPPPLTQTSGVTAGPILISSSSSQPVIYGQDIQLGIQLNNVGAGIPIGSANLSISLNSSRINISGASALGFKLISFSNGTELLFKSLSIGPAGATIELPIALSSSEYSKLINSNIPDVLDSLHFTVSYSYEQEGYLPIGLYISPYSI